jgi:hypothetical protein
MSAMLESLSEQILATRFLTCRYIATEARCIFVTEPTAAQLRPPRRRLFCRRSLFETLI